MKHKFRKYIGNRGSALFMVISVMTALIVTCMAMYFSVVSSRKTQYAIFNQQQSYQSALSISESVLGAIIEQKNDANGTGFDELAAVISSMNIGDTISTSDNGFASFSASGTGSVDDDQVGAYTVDITLLDNADGVYYLDVAATTMVNGTESVVHQYVEMPGSVVEKPSRRAAPERLFTSSGLNPNDTYIGMGGMYCDVFYDTEYTIVMPYQQSQGTNAKMQYMGDIYAAGSLEIYYNLEKTAEKYEWAGVRPLKWVVRKDLKLDNSYKSVPFPTYGDQLDVTTKYPNARNRVIVGGNFTVGTNSMGMEHVDIYVGGDIFVGSAKITNADRIFVKGNVYIQASSVDLNKFYLGPDSSIIVESGSTTGSAKKWNDVMSDPTVLNETDLSNEILLCTESRTYYDWSSEYESIAGITAGYKNKDTNATIDPIFKNLTFSGTDPAITLTYKKGIEEGCTITNIDTSSAEYSDESQGGGCKLIVDTGDDPDAVYTIRVTGYIEGNIFSWTKDSSMPFWVLLKGKGSLVIEVPDGVTYKNVSYRTNLMHYNWYALGACSDQFGDNVKDIQEYIHWECPEHCSECVYHMEEVEETCDFCGENKTFIWCDNHNLRKVMCLDCEKDFVYLDSDGNPYGMCQDRAERNILIDRLGRNDYTNGRDVNKINGVPVCPTTNIYLSVCGQTSDLILTPPDRETFCKFWGYIYAPYTTIRLNSNLSSGDKICFMGGITAADYALTEYHVYVGMWPDKLPSEIMSDECKEHELIGMDSKQWKSDHILF